MPVGDIFLQSFTFWTMQCSYHISKRRIRHLFYLIHNYVEVYMDDFIVYGNSFEEALENLEKVLIWCQETNLDLSNEKWHMLLIEGIVLGHHISYAGIKFDLAKNKVITKLLAQNF